MRWLAKLWRLLVDDPALAAAVPFWCLLCAWAAPRFSAGARGGLLFTGLAASLAAAVLRGVRLLPIKL